MKNVMTMVWGVIIMLSVIVILKNVISQPNIIELRIGFAGLVLSITTLAALLEED